MPKLSSKKNPPSASKWGFFISVLSLAFSFNVSVSVTSANAACVNSYQAATIAAAATPTPQGETATVTTIETCGGDDNSYQVPITTAVTYDGVQFNSVYATTNSVITFGQPDGTYWTYPSTPSISIASIDWVVYPNARNDEHLIISASDGGFQVDLSARPIWNQTTNVQPTNIVVTAAINTDGTVAISYVLAGPDWAQYNPRTGARLTNGTVVPLEQANIQQVQTAPVLTPEPVTPTPEPSISPTPEPTPSPSVTPEPSPTPQESSTPSPTAEPSQTPTPQPTPTIEPTPTPTPSITPSPSPSSEPSPTPSPSATPEPAVEPSPSSSPEPAPQVTPTPAPVPSEPSPAPTPIPSPEPSNNSQSPSSPTPSVEPTPPPAIEPSPRPTPIPSPEPVAEPTPTPVEPAPTPIEQPPVEEPPAVELPPVEEPSPQPVEEPKPIEQPEPTPIEEPAPTEPEPTPEPPIVEPLPEPTPEPVVEPVIDPVVEPVVEPTPEPVVHEVIKGLIENNPNSLPEKEPKLPNAEDLKPRVQVDKAGVENGGIEFFGTKSQPQVIGEDGKLTPAPPAPGSGDYLNPDAITTADTFIGQAGGVTFNSPDVAVPVELVEVEIPQVLDLIPSAGEAIQALNATYVALANIGNDMSPVTRKKAKKILVATIIASPLFRRRFGE